MNIGTIISFLADSETHYGQIIILEEGSLTVKILFSDIAVDIFNWKEGLRVGTISIPFTTDKSFIDFHKTVVVTAIRDKPLTWWNKCFYKMQGIEYEWRLRTQGEKHRLTDTSEIWIIRFKRTGVLFADGMFAPMCFGKLRLYDTFYFEQYNKLKLWQMITDRPFNMSYGKIRPGQLT